MEKKKKQHSERFYPAALTIAGSDSGGSSGIQADLRTFNAFGVFGCCALTAVASQNPGKTTRIDHLPAAGVTAQIDAVMSAVNLKFCKSGRLFSRENIAALADAVQKYQLKLICDPALIADDGSKLLPDDAAISVMDKLLPGAAWITPNIAEAGFLLGHPVAPGNGIFEAAKELFDKFGVSVLLKGGLDSAVKPGKFPVRLTDAVCRNGEVFKLSSLRVDVPKLAMHGAGCTFSAALTAAFALELPWKEALCESKAFVLGSLVENVRIGSSVSAMYPPTNDYMASVQLEEVAF